MKSRTIKFLKATTAVSATSWYLTLLSAAVVFGVSSAALAEPNTDQVTIPLHHSIVATPRGGLGWQHAFVDVPVEINLAFAGGSAGSTAREGRGGSRNGLEMNFTKTASLGLTYEGQLASDAKEHGFNAKLAVRF